MSASAVAIEQADVEYNQLTEKVMRCRIVASGMACSPHERSDMRDRCPAYRYAHAGYEMDYPG
jgi:hypothetical protein